MNGFHCPLCIPHLSPGPDDVYIFLDMDGILSLRLCDSDTARKIQCTVKEKFKCDNEKYTDLQWRCAAAEHLNQESLDNFRKLVEAIQTAQKRVFIILSSDWRSCGTLKDMKEEVFVKHPIIAENLGGKTPSEKLFEYREDRRVDTSPEADTGFDFETIANKYYANSLKTRAEQIDFWLKFHCLDGSNYIILDDKDDDLSKQFGKRFIYTFGIRDEIVDKALKVLNIHKQSIKQLDVERQLINQEIIFLKKKTKDIGVKNNALQSKACKGLLPAKKPTTKMQNAVTSIQPFQKSSLKSSKPKPFSIP
jgi:hypothetical protein